MKISSRRVCFSIERYPPYFQVITCVVNQQGTRVPIDLKPSPLKHLEAIKWEVLPHQPYFADIAKLDYSVLFDDTWSD